MKITSVSRYKGTTFEVEIDGERKLYLHADMIADYNVREGLELDRTELRKIIYASNFRRAYQYALYRLDYRDYSFSEMYSKLLDTYKSEALCTAVMKKLVQAGAIDDERYAERLARKLVVSKMYGRRRVLREMKEKGIEGFTAEDALEQYEYTFFENLMTLLETKHARYLTDSSDRRSVEKVKAALARYGYDFSEINRAVREYFENHEEQLEDNE